MKIDPSLARLREEASRRTELAKEALLNGDKETARENIEWVNISNSVIEKYNQKPDIRRLSIIIGLVSIFVIGAGLLIRLPATNISIDLTTKSISVRLKKDWIISNRFTPSKLNVSNVQEIYGAGAGIKVHSDVPFGVDLEGKKIVIDQFVIPANSEVSIILRDSTQNLIIKTKGVKFDVQVGRARLEVNDGQVDTTVTYEIPEIFNLKSFSSETVPFVVSLTDTSNWSFRGMSVSEINFLEESPPGSGKFTSSIISGKVKVLETEQEYAIDEGDWLHLTNLENRKMQLTKSGSLLKLRLEGEVSEVRSGSELFEKTLNPSLAEYLYYAKSFAFFWSCIVFIWSMIWSVKNSVFSR